MSDWSPSLNTLTAEILEVSPKGRRRLIALAGPPASGKSTLAEALVARLNKSGNKATLVPMDGFHLDNRVLEARGLLSRKGAPETFDAQGFVRLIKALAQEVEVIFPIFDRSRDIAIAGAGVVAADDETIVVEGNYLLLARAPWHALGGLWDYAAILEVPLEELRVRLIQRWEDHGHSAEAAAARADANDMENARLVLSHSVSARRITNGAL